MAKLIIINWPCGVWKSTLAKKIFEEIENSVYINIDDLRRNISQHKKNREYSLKLVLKLANAILKETLKNWNTVIIDKMIFEHIWYGVWEKNIINKYIKIAKKNNVKYFEIILWANWQETKKRVLKRWFVKWWTFTIEKAREFWEWVTKFKKTRKNAIIIDTSILNEEKVFEYVVEKIW